MVLAGLLCAVMGAAEIEPVPLPVGVTRLTDIGLYRVGYTYTDGRSGLMPIGWVGRFHEPTGIHYATLGQQDGKACLLIHCPWRGGTGVTYVEYPLRLGRVKPIKLELAVAMKSDAVAPGRSDGSNFRVSVQPKGGPKTMLFDRHYDSARWQPLSFDLTAHAGQDVVIRLETGPGPKNDPSFDHSLFGDPQIVVGGKPGGAAPAPIWPAQTDLARLANRTDVGCCPTGPVVGETHLDWDEASGVARYQVDWPKDRGRITYTVRTRGDGQNGPSDLIDVFATVFSPGDRGPQNFRVGASSGVVLTDGKRTWTTESGDVRIRPVGGQDTTKPDRPDTPLRVDADYVVDGLQARVIREFRLCGTSLMVTVRSPSAAIGEVRFGGAIAPIRRTVAVPYLGLGPVWYLPDAQVYGSIVLDWTSSKASRHDQMTAHYDPMTDGKRNPVSTTAYYTFSPRLGEVVCNIPNPPSPYLADLAGRIMFDVWGGKYRDDADWFGQLATYGVHDAAIIKHAWQRSGYDNALPNHYPANEALGGDEAMKHYVRTTRELGHRTSLHENYIDSYPNSELHDENDLSRAPNGKLVKAWFNGGTGIQSYAIKPTAIVKYAQTQSPEIHRRYGTNAGYLDVHTCVPPWFRVDHRTGEPGAATFAAVWNAYVELFAFERKAHAGPLFGEGNNHFFWAGLCDGCEAQVSGGESAAWLVDFDLLKIHPQMVNHGMGYMERWLSSGYQEGWHTKVPTTRALDRYRAMSLAFGHAGFVAQQAWHQLPYVLREYYLVTPIQQRYTTAKPCKILYDVGGRMLPASQAVAAGPLSNRVHVEYDGGLKLWCNGSEESWTVPGGVLCGYGFRAEAPGLLATTTTWPTADGRKVVADYRESDEIIYADTRSFEPDPGVAIEDVEPSVKAFASVGARRFKITYAWRVGRTPSKDWTCYVHFTSPAAKGGGQNIAFQNDHNLSKPASKWEAGASIVDGPHEVAVPAELPDGRYEIMIGLYGKWGRAVLPFKSDLNGRCSIGTVVVTGEGVTCTPHALRRTQSEAGQGPYDGHTNPGKAIVDFGKVATNGCVAIRPMYKSWWVTPVPRKTPFTIRVRMDRLDPKAGPGGWRVRPIKISGREWGTVDVKVTGEQLEWQAGQPMITHYCITK